MPSVDSSSVKASCRPTICSNSARENERSPGIAALVALTIESTKRGGNSLSVHTAQSEPPPLEESDANAKLTAGQVLARERDEQARDHPHVGRCGGIY